MTVAELISRFPEIPRDLHSEKTLREFAEKFSHLLANARNPSNCTTDYTPEHHYYLKLIGPLKIYMYGLASRDKTLAQMRELMSQYDQDPEAFIRGLAAEPDCD